MRRYWLAFLLVFALGLLLALPSGDLGLADARELLRLAKPAQPKVILLGNSVSRTASRCDDDRRSIGDLVAAANVPVTELALGGLTLDRMRDYLRVASAVRDVEVAFLPVQLSHGFFRTLSPQRQPRVWRTLANEWKTAAPPESDPPSYEGVSYGSYADIAANNFPVERNTTACPEPFGVNRSFVKYMYWRNYRPRPEPMKGFDEFVHFSAEMKARGLRVVPVLMPLNADLMTELNGAEFVATARAEARRMSEALAAQNIEHVDLTTVVAGVDFADPWCACGHLTHNGRAEVARKLVDFLKAAR